MSAFAIKVVPVVSLTPQRPFGVVPVSSCPDFAFFIFTLASTFPTVCLSSSVHATFTGRISVRFDIEDFCEKSLSKSKYG
jgi:hypothetical protein